MKINKGISLLVLVITIIVIIILAGIVIVSITKNNPISAANEALFKSDIDSFQSELSMYHINNYSKSLGQYEENKLQADNTKVEYTGVGQVETQSMTIKDIITGLKSKKYENEFEIINGKLAYKGTNATNQQWSLDIGILVDNDKTTVTIATSNILPIKQTGSIEYIIDVYSNVGIKDIGDITSSIKVIDKDSNEVTATVTVGQIKSLTNEKQIPVTVQGTGLVDGEYKVKLLAGAVENNANLKNVDVISINSFTVDSTAPTNPSIVPSITNWINQDITATITYQTDSVKNEYSYDGSNWQTYTTTLTISSNCTVYARATDAAGNVSGESTLSITNIDRQNPIVSFSPNGQNNVQKAETTVIVTDNSNEFSNLQYIWSTNTTEPTDGWITFENNAKLSKDAVTASYYLWIKAVDAAGNITTVKSEAFGIDNTVPEAPGIVPSTANWTNQNITATITYPSDSIKNEYSYDSTNWSNYTTILTISSNCVIYARATDTAGNISAQSTLSITNIDKTAPTYSSYNITNVTSEGYDVYIYGVTDAGSGVNRVQFPTWTDYNGQDDLISDWGTNISAKGQNQGNGTWYFRVNRHNNEFEKYETHIYFYDNLGNYNMVATTGANVLPRQYTVTAIAGTGGTVSGSGTYSENSTATITATPNSGYKFINWSDGTTSASKSFIVNSNLSYTANFDLDAFGWIFSGTYDIVANTSTSVTNSQTYSDESYFTCSSSGSHQVYSYGTYTFNVPMLLKAGSALRLINSTFNYPATELYINGTLCGSAFSGGAGYSGDGTYDIAYVIPSDTYVNTVMIRMKGEAASNVHNSGYARLFVTPLNKPTFLLNNSNTSAGQKDFSNLYYATAYVKSSDNYSYAGLGSNYAYFRHSSTRPVYWYFTRPKAVNYISVVQSSTTYTSSMSIYLKDAYGTRSSITYSSNTTTPYIIYPTNYAGLNGDQITFIQCSDNNGGIDPTVYVTVYFKDGTSIQLGSSNL